MSDNTTSQVRLGRRKLLLVVAIFLAPLALAIGWYRLAPTFVPGSAAHGTLINPARPIRPFTVPMAQGGTYTLDDLRGHWSLVHVVGGRCEAECRQRLYDTRQARAALGKNAYRMHRLALAREGRDTPGLSDNLERHPDLEVLRMSSNRPFAGQFGEQPPAGTEF
ncbi:MAG TPA: hypothetical protein VKA32_08205, partial [Gammaproteobacteria bacterium]|nr:hypothetical protein [Gammaproteobacteria bacterium]